MAHLRARRIWATLIALFAAALIPAHPAQRDIYPAPEQAKSDLAAALTSAAMAERWRSNGFEPPK